MNWCATCFDGGSLIICDSCPKAYHIECESTLSIGSNGYVDVVLPEGTWNCIHCRSLKSLPAKEKIRKTFVSDLLSRIEGKSMLGIVLYSELVLRKEPREKILDIWMKYKGTEKDLDFSYDFSYEKKLPTAQQQSLLFSTIRILKEQEIYDEVFKNQDGVDLCIISGFGGTLPRASIEKAEWNNISRQTRCGCCGESRIFRTRCYHCNARTCLSGAISPLLKTMISRIPIRHSNNVKRVCERENKTREGLRLEAIERGLTQLRKCLDVSRNFRVLGGDMIFLSQKLDIALTNASKANANRFKSIHVIYHDWLLKTAKRWMMKCNSLPSDAEVADLLNIVEGIHALKRLNLNDSTSSSSSGVGGGGDSRHESVEDEEKKEEEDKYISSSLTISSNRKQRNASKKAIELIRMSRTMEEKQTLRKRNKKKGPGRKMKKKKRKLQDFGGGCHVFDESRYDSSNKIFSFSDMISEITNILSFHHVTDVIGFDPTSENGFPMTAKNHCSNCAAVMKRGKTRCEQCQSYMFKSVDWGGSHGCLRVVISFRGCISETEMSWIRKSRTLSYISNILTFTFVSSSSLLLT